MSLSIQRLDAQVSIEAPRRTAAAERRGDARDEVAEITEERLDRERRVEQRDPRRLGGR